MFSPRQGHVIADRYALVREIGRGGMGSVWEARDLELDAPCALKFILEHIADHPELRKRFLREARAVAQLPSPHVVSIRGVGEHDGVLYTAMELLHGETLESRLGREGALDPLSTLKIVHQVASVLALAHAAGITHRDLKPENIWLWAGDSLFTKLIDFGVAKHVLGTSLVQTSSGALVGTPRYMSPEQAAGGREVDPRSDVWSLAVIAVQCLSGRCPFESEGFGELLVKIIHGPIPSLRELYPEASDELEAWWQQASQRNPDERFQSATALAESLGAALRPSLLPRLLHARAGDLASLPPALQAQTGSGVTAPPAGVRARARSGTQDSLPPTELSMAGARVESPRVSAASAREEPLVKPTPNVIEKVPMTRVSWLPVAALVSLAGATAYWQFGGFAPSAGYGVASSAEPAIAPPHAGAPAEALPAEAVEPSPEPAPKSSRKQRAQEVTPVLSSPGDAPAPVKLTRTPPSVVRAGTKTTPRMASDGDPALTVEALRLEAQKTTEQLDKVILSLRPKPEPKKREVKPVPKTALPDGPAPVR